MTEATWDSAQSEPPPKKKGMPKWIFACGLGCLLMLVVGAIGIFLAGRAFKEMMDPEVQWAELEQVLPFDERPDYTIVGIPLVSMSDEIDGMWTLMDGQNSGTIMAFRAGEIDADDFFDPEQNEMNFGKWTGDMGLHDFELGTIRVQGRDLRIARFRSHPLDEVRALEEEEEEEDGEMGLMDAFKKAAARIELTPEDDEERILVIEYAKPGSLERLTDEELVEFLAPFHIGPDR